MNEVNAARAQELVQSIGILNRTRESIKSTEDYLGKPGQHLDRSLSRIILAKEAELESFPRASVIVRSSTPDPTSRCEERSPHSHLPFDPNHIPKDYSLPLRYLFDSQGDSVISLASVHKQGHTVDHRLSKSAPPPEVPWSPDRQVLDDEVFSKTCTSELLISPETLLIDTQTMAFFNAKVECTSKNGRFNQLLSEDDPEDMEPEDAAREMENIFAKLSSALDELRLSTVKLTMGYENELGAQGRVEWEDKVSSAETKFKTFKKQMRLSRLPPST